MLFIVRFTDNSEAIGVRQQFFPAHIEWLKAHRDIVRVAGSLRPEPDANPVGALWVVEAGSKTAIEELLRTDPFWVNGLRAGYEILHWIKGIPEDRVPI